MSRFPLTLLAMLAIFAAREARAVDGVIEINHARAVAGGVTPGDTAGYPVTLSQPGSYRLTGSLTPQSTSAIAITASGVTVDLNDFRLVGGANVEGVLGIDAAGRTDVHIHNGTVESFGGNGIVAGDRAWLEKVAVRSNGSGGAAGMSVGSASMVIGCLVHGNSGDGIFAGAASTVRDSQAVANGQSGIDVLAGSTVTGNTANGNNFSGLVVGEGSTVSGNTSTFNNGDGIQCVVGGCSVLNNTVGHNGGDGIEVAGSSAVIGNTIQLNARCGLHAEPSASCVACVSGFAHNV